MQRLGARWAAVTRGEGGVGHAEMGKMVALGPSWVLGRGEAGPASWAHAGEGKGRVGSLLGWVWLWVCFLFLSFYFFSFLNLNQTKFEFKYKFEFKPHSNI